jgi:hypothetical protein
MIQNNPSLISKSGAETLPSSTDLHFVHAMVSGDLIGSDDEVLLLDG